MNKIQYHDTILDLVGNTPLVSLQKITSPMLGQFFAKLEAFNPGHSAKDRTALYIINDAEERGLLTPGRGDCGDYLRQYRLQYRNDCRHSWLPLYPCRNGQILS